MYFANKTAEIELEREMAATNSFSIGSSMTMKPASPERQATINGGALADDFVLAVESENETETGNYNTLDYVFNYNVSLSKYSVLT